MGLFAWFGKKIGFLVESKFIDFKADRRVM